MQTRFCFSKFRRYCRNTGIFLGQDSIPRLKTTAQLDATRQTTNNSFRRNLSKVICMPFCLRRFHPYTIYSPFFLGIVCSYSLGHQMQKQQTWLWDAFASKWPPGQKAGDSVRGGISPPCSGSHACHSHTHKTRGSWTHLSSQHPLFNSPFSGASTKANLPEWNSSSPSVHLTPILAPEPTLSPVYSSEMQFQNFFNNSFCSSHRIWPLLLDPTRCMPKTAF